MKVINKLLLTTIILLVSICALSLTVFAAEECEHTGGQATCTDRAVCVNCGEEYGELDPVRHSGDFFYAPTEGDSTKHDVLWSCCKLYLYSEYHVEDPDNMPTCTKKGSCYRCKVQYLDKTEHDFSEASCTYPKTCYNCDYTEGELLPHTGGEAGCFSLAKCEVCGAEYGDILGHTGGEATCTEEAVCERCGESYGDLLAHTGGEATCQSFAICEICGEAYGELGDHKQDEKWTIEEDFHYNACLNEGCTDIFNDADHDDENNDGKCDICEYKFKLSQAEKVWIIVGASLGAVVLIGAIVATIIVVKKKRKAHKTNENSEN